MNIKKGRFFTFLMKEETQKYFAFTCYSLFIVMFIGTGLPLSVQFIFGIFHMFIIMFLYMSYILEMIEKNIEKTKKNIIQEVKKIAKEITMFIPIVLLDALISSHIIIGESANQTSVVESFYESPIYGTISIIIITPIIEEVIFRFLPYRFIKNKGLYIIISAVVFSAMHVISDSNPFYYIWSYMIISLYLGYRYYNTKDILVTISIHSFKNLIAILVLIFA